MLMVFVSRSKIPLFTPSFLASNFFVGFPQASVGRFGKSAKNKLATAKGFSFHTSEANWRSNRG